MNHTEELSRFGAAFVDELTKMGVENVVVSPGSRSTPLAMLLNKHQDIKVWINIDERSAAFFALGMAKASKRPTALLCTSGTAAANYFPAIVEARLSRVPLIVLTSDRPHELRGVGAPQSIDQLKMYGENVKWFQEMPLPSGDASALRFSRTTARRAVTTSSVQPSGPVHLNFPFKEPLVPDLLLENLWESGRMSSGDFSMTAGSIAVSDDQIKSLTQAIKTMKKGLIVVGPQVDDDLTDHIIRLAECCGFPILADPLSQLRTGEHDKTWVMDCYDAFLREESFSETFKPDGVIRIGPMPVSKPFLLYLNKVQPNRYIVVDEGQGWREPTHLATDMVYADPCQLCQALLDELSDGPISNLGWGKAWMAVNQTARTEIEGYTSDGVWFEGQVISKLLPLLPSEAALFVGNSMPIRDLDTFLLNQTPNIMTFANRGANGIDGVTSTALGVSTVTHPLYLIIGDLSFFHDMNGLLAGKLHQLNATIIVINNDGGGIFSFLPQAQEAEDFEQLFGTPTGLNIEAVADLYQATYEKVDSWEAYCAFIRKTQKNSGLRIIELQTNRTDNTAKHKELWEQVSHSVRKVIEIHG